MITSLVLTRLNSSWSWAEPSYRTARDLLTGWGGDRADRNKGVHTGKSLGDEETETGSDGKLKGWKEEEEETKEEGKESFGEGVLLKSNQLGSIEVCLAHFKENKKKRGQGPIEIPE